MRLFFDDSGDFAIPLGSDDKVSLWMGIGIPETCIERIQKKYLAWEDITKTRLNVQEPKGCMLDETARSQLFREIEDESDLLIQPGIVDLQIQKKYMPIDMPSVMRSLGIDASKRMKDKASRNILETHGRRLGNLSKEQLLKFMVLSFCIVETLRHCILFRSHDAFRECWNDVVIVIDQSSQANNSREELVFKESIRWALHNITKRNPFGLIEGIHDKDHPFIKKYDSEKGIRGEELFQNMSFENSNRSWELRLADIIANTMFKSLNDLENTSGMLTYYKKIMKYSPLGPRSNLGFTCITGSSELGDKITAPRFAILQRILDSYSVS